MSNSNSQQRQISFLLFISRLLMGMAVTLYVPSLPVIAHYFAVSDQLVQLSIGLYTLGYGIGQGILGVLSDSYGRRKIFILSALFFTLFSFLVIFYTPNIYVFNSYIFAQGFAIAGLGSLCRAIASDCYTGLALTKAMTVIAISFALGPLIAPPIGAYLQHYFNWQADFYFLGGYGLLVFIMSIIILPETNKYLQELKPAKVIKQIKEVAFHPVFVMQTILVSLIYAIVIVFNTIGPFLIQIVLGFSVIEYGHIALLLGVGYFFGTILNRFIINYIDPMKVSMYALLAVLTASLIISLSGFNNKATIYGLLVPLWLSFFLCGPIFSNIMAKSMQLFSHAAGTASAVFGVFQGTTVFIMTTIASHVKADSQTSLGFLYMAMLLICLLLFFVSKSVEERFSQVPVVN